MSVNEAGVLMRTLMLAREDYLEKFNIKWMKPTGKLVIV